MLLCSSIVALSYNVIHSLMIQKTSAVTTTVLGEVKIVGLLILSALLLGKPVMSTSTHRNMQILQMRAYMSLIRCCSLHLMLLSCFAITLEARNGPCCDLLFLIR